MTLFVTAFGTQTATVTTEHSLATVSSPKSYTLTVDTSNMVFGSTNDELELKVKTKALTGGTERVAYYSYFVGAQDIPIKISIPVPVAYTATFTLKQTAGTSRNFDWNITTPDA